MLRQTLFWIIVVLHAGLISWLLISPFISNNKRYLCFVLVFFIALGIQRYLIKHCFLTIWEHQLNPTLVPNPNISYTQSMLYKVFDKNTIHFIFEYLPYIYIALICYKLYY